jgi:hypothetical protein
VVDDLRVDPSDFASRWRAARLQALRRGLALLPGASRPDDEVELLAQVTEARQEFVLRYVFDNSRKLGLSIARLLGVVWETSDFHDVLSKVPVACLSGEWTRTKTGVVLKREGCAEVGRIGPFFCDYWREAIDGLVMGAGDTERYARHASRGHGDATCEDVFFDDAIDAHGERPAYAPVPERVLEGLAETAAAFAQADATLSFVGLKEGVLHYKLESAGAPCGDPETRLKERLAHEVAQRFPGLRLQDVSPSAVLSGRER